MDHLVQYGKHRKKSSGCDVRQRPAYDWIDDSVMITCWSAYLIRCWYSSRVVQWNMKHIKSTGLARSKAQRYAHWVLSSMHHSFKAPRRTPKSPLKLRKSPAPKKVSRGDGTYLVFPRYVSMVCFTLPWDSSKTLLLENFPWTPTGLRRWIGFVALQMRRLPPGLLPRQGALDLGARDGCG